MTIRTEWDSSVCITVTSNFSIWPAIVGKAYKKIRLHSNVHLKKMDCLMVCSYKYGYLSNLSTIGALRSSCNTEPETTWFFLFYNIEYLLIHLMILMNLVIFMDLWPLSHFVICMIIWKMVVYWVLLTFHSKFTFDYTFDIYLVLSKPYSLVWLLVLSKSL